MTFTPALNLSGSVHRSQLHSPNLDLALAPICSVTVCFACAMAFVATCGTTVRPAPALICCIHRFDSLQLDIEVFGL